MVLWLDYVESALRNTADSLRIFSNGQDEMVGWHHQLNGREFEQTPGDSEGQGSLVYLSPWVRCWALGDAGLIQSGSMEGRLGVPLVNLG